MQCDDDSKEDQACRRCVTRTARAKSLLVLLQEAGGKRTVIDFDAEGLQALQQLITAGDMQVLKRTLC